jgi:hypothetical protein
VAQSADAMDLIQKRCQERKVSALTTTVFIGDLYESSEKRRWKNKCNTSPGCARSKSNDCWACIESKPGFIYVQVHNTDKEISRHKGPPVFNEQERY